MPRKRRTREHVIEDLSFNYLERFIFKCGYSAERIGADYGIDLTIFTYNSNGEIESGSIAAQLKGTDSIHMTGDGTAVEFRVEKAHLEHWLDEPMPVVLVVHAAKEDVAFWLYVQRYFESQADFNLDQARKIITVHIPVGNAVNEAAILQLAAFKQAVLDQIRGVIRHA